MFVVLMDGGVVMIDEFGVFLVEEVVGVVVGFDDDVGVGVGDKDGVVGLGE